jgi:hypothetical protein
MRISHLLPLLGLMVTGRASAIPIVTTITNAPYTISSPGTYRLANNISWTGTGPSNAVAITINANNVVLDLNGKTVTGNQYFGLDVFTAYGIAATNVSNLTVFNGTVNGFRSGGVLLSSVNQAKLYNLTIENINNLGLWSGLFTVDMVSGFIALGSTNVCLSNVLVQNINLQPTNDNTTFAQAGGVIAAGCANFTNIGVTITGVTNNAGVAEGIAALDCTGVTVLRSTVSNIRTGQGATNNFVGHTCLGMVFSPSRLSANITGATVTSGGSGYSGYPPVTISPVTNDSGSTNYGYAVVSPQGQVTGIVLTGIATNYETFPQVTIGGSGTGAEAVVQPNQVSYTTIGYCGNIKVADCNISNIIGAIDDAHGISLFTVTNAVIQRVHVNTVVDGQNSYNFGGSKATGFENYGNPSATNCNIVLEDCVAQNVIAIGPADLAANGFSAAGNGIRFNRCTASNVIVAGINRLDPLASPGTAAGFGWAPDVRIQNIYPAKNTVIEGCTVMRSLVCFDTYNFQNSVWRNNRPIAVPNGIRYLQEPALTDRTIFGSIWNEVVDAALYPDGIKAIPIYNQAQGNQITPVP